MYLIFIFCLILFLIKVANSEVNVDVNYRGFDSGCVQVNNGKPRGARPKNPKGVKFNPREPKKYTSGSPKEERYRKVFNKSKAEHRRLIRELRKDRSFEIELEKFKRDFRASL